MPAPPANSSDATALELDWTTYTVGAGLIALLTPPNYDLWFFYLRKVNEAIVGVQAEAVPSGGTYVPRITGFTGSPGSLTQIFDTSGIAQPATATIPVAPSTPVYFRVRQSGVGVPNGALTFKITTAPTGLAPRDQELA